MARLLTDKDYTRSIQIKNLDEVITGDYALLHEVEQSAQAEMISYLVQRYDVNQIFTDTTQFDLNATYYSNNLIQYTEPKFDIRVDYAPPMRVSYEGKIYENIGTSSFAGVTPDVSADWNYITEDLSYYTLKYNNPKWSITTKYTTGSVVWWNNKDYTAKVDNMGKIPSDNPEEWLEGTTYSVTNELPTNTTYWIKTDNRNQQIVMFLMDITLYHVHARISPRNVPERIAVRYDGMNATQNGGAIAWLKRIADGIITADLPQLLPTQGLSIQWGTTDTNSY